MFCFSDSYTPACAVRLHASAFSAVLRDIETCVEQRLDWLCGLQRQHRALLTSAALRPVLGHSRGSTFAGVMSVAMCTNLVRYTYCACGADRSVGWWPWPAVWSVLSLVHVLGPMLSSRIVGTGVGGTFHSIFLCVKRYFLPAVLLDADLRDCQRTTP